MDHIVIKHVSGILEEMHSLPLHDNEALAKCAWQAARQSGEVEPVGYVSGDALENLKRGHPVHAYAPDTPLVFGSKVWIYTHPPAPAQGVTYLFDSVVSPEILEYANGDDELLVRRIWDDVRRAMLSAPDHGVPSPCPYCEGRGGTGEDWCVACDATGLKRPEPPKDKTQEGE